MDKKAILKEVERIKKADLGGITTKDFDFLISTIREGGCRSEVARFAEKMEEQLQENNHKGSWRNEQWLFLLAELETHVAALRRFMEDSNPRQGRIGHEAADVANFAMMIADNEGAI